MSEVVSSEERNGLCLLERLKQFVVIISQYQTNESDLSHKTSKNLHELDLYLDGTGYTARDIFKAFCSDDFWPCNGFEFLALYLQHKANIALETELFTLHEDFRENRDTFKIVRAWFDHDIARLLQQGLDYNVCDDDGNNLLIMAAATGSKIIVEHILSQALHPDINTTNQAGEDAFLVAVKYGYYDIAQFLLQQNACPTMDKGSLLACIGQYDTSLLCEIHKHQLRELIHTHIK